jgi:hypothetical protein
LLRSKRRSTSRSTKRVTIQQIEKALRDRLEAGRVSPVKILKTDFFLCVTLVPELLEEIVGDVKGKEAIPGISRIWLNKKTEALLDVSNQTIKAQAARNVFKVEGEGIVWAVLDTGIDKGNRWIRDAVVGRMNFTNDPEGDQNGHGTHVAGIIASRSPAYPGIAPRARLYDLKVLDRDGRGTDFAVIRAMQEVRKINAASRDFVIHGVNISLGTPESALHRVAGPHLRNNQLMLSGVVCVAAGRLL